ncbi:MAG: MgtC/SapB family protein [Spirochaetales bacterium]|nr:MgtC/SapB family protein [Spirochaetales bacterium]MCF7937186.1 MgtC/SapB family protein [Spirochaetales bacterium]
MDIASLLPSGEFFFVIPFPEVLLRLGLSLVLSAFIGIEREFHDQPAGFRTHILISLGATILMLVSIAVPVLFNAGGEGDPGRIAAQVVSGIGFLGAGAIIKFGADIRGLTTAASIWAVAALGLTIGAGLYYTSVITFVLILFALIVLNRFEHRIFKQRILKVLTVSVRTGSLTSESLKRAALDFGMRIRSVNLSYSHSEKETTFRILLYVPRHFAVERFIDEFGDIDGLRKITLEEL